MDTQVIVVGGGPVGLMLAGELRLGGADVTVLERRVAPRAESRASTLHARTMELFDQRGLVERLDGPPNESHGHFGGLPLDFSGLDTPYPGLWKVPQPRVEELLREWAAGLGADLRRGYDVWSVAQRGEYAEVAGPGRAAPLRAAFVVGCDGEQSTVRARARFTVPGRDADTELLCADVDGIAVPDRRFERTATGLAVAARRPDGITRLMVHAFGHRAGPRSGPPSFAEIVAEWRHVTGEDVGTGTPVWLHAFGNTTRLVERYRIDRVLLAGDAAHQQLPSGGQALNLGLQDAVNLGWKLAAALAGRAGDGLLDSYHDERHLAARLVQRNVEAQTRLLLAGPEVNAARTVLGELMRFGSVRARLAGLISGLDLRYGAAGADHPLLGARLPPARFEAESGPVGVAALLRAGRGLLIDRSPAHSGTAARWAGRVDVVRPADPSGGPVPGAGGVLVRPDGHIAWVADTGMDLEAALRRWFGAPEGAGTRPATVPPAHSPESKESGAHVSRKVMVMSDTKESARARECDVVILGSGLAGSISGSILARQGADVVLIDASQHPRFAVGESMTPQLVEWLHILADRYDVPEIRHLLDVKGITRHITATHGRKQHFGFIRHEPGKEPDPREANMFVIPSILTESCHLYRQDTDSYFFHVAARYGCTPRQNWRAVDVDFDEDGVTVTGHNGERFRAKYLIDASGYRSPLAEKFDLREKPARFKHHSRSLFTHYIGIKPFDEVSHHPASLRPPALWHGGTLHHLIERGWFWIIPFDNHKDSMNPLCSVGLTFDERMYPKPADMTPDQEFNHYLDMYPAVKRQFEGATRVREWVSTDRLQYSSKHSIGHRWCLMSHAAGFLDPLFSRGLSNTFEVVDALVSRILTSLRDGDWSVQRYEYVDRLERGLLQYNDDLVNSSFISFSHFRLWNAVFRVWASFITPGTLRLTRARLNFALDRDDGHFKALEDNPYPGLWWPDSPDLKNILETTAELCEKYEVGEIDPDTAADTIFGMLRDCDFVNPVFGWKDPEDTRFIHPNPAMMARFVWWASTQAPPEMRAIGRGFAKGIVKSGFRGQKVL